MFVKFFYSPELSGTSEDGLPLYVNVVFVEIHMDSTNVFIGKATEDHLSRFPQIYEAFEKKNKINSFEGFPLEMWTRMLPADVENCRARGIYTVQQLAKLDASKAPAFIAEQVLAARSFVEVAGKGAADMKMIETMNDKLESLEEAVKNRDAKIARLEKALEKADAA